MLFSYIATRLNFYLNRLLVVELFSISLLFK